MRGDSSEHHLAVGKAHCVLVEHLLMNFKRKSSLIHEAAPCHVARVARLDLRPEKLAHRRADAVCADQEIAALARPVGERRRDAGCVLLEALERHPRAVARRGKGVFEQAVDAPPRALQLGYGEAVGHAPAAVQADPRGDPHADAVVHRHFQAAQRGDQFAVRADPRAAARQRLADALEHRGVPADPAQRVRDEQARCTGFAGHAGACASAPPCKATSSAASAAGQRFIGTPPLAI
jgi:hypothetical protein